MKKAIMILLALVLSTFSLHPLQAQTIDQDRMNRDINIMESVLSELFKTRWSARNSQVHAASGAFTLGGSGNISGTYVQDYGVIFTIPARNTGFVMSTAGEGFSYSFQYGDDDKEVSRDNIVSRITTFLQDYGSTIGQLQNSEHVTVIYEGSSRSHTLRVFASADENETETEEVERQPLPTLHVTARKSDLDAYRRGSLSEAQFRDRLTVQTVDEEGGQRDLRIMSNILKSSFEDRDSDAFRIRGSVNHLYLDNLGAIFNVEASYGSGLFALNEAVVVMREKLTEIVNSDSASVRVSRAPRSADTEKIQARRKEAYQQLIDDIKGVIVDYGRTLRSVQSDEKVLVTVDVSTRSDYLPDQATLQIDKAVLEQFDRGDLSRAQAISRITVREY